jgi:hypothetical protein
VADAQWACEVLLPRLLDRIAEHQVPWRPGRSYPRPKDRKIKYKYKRRNKKKVPAQLEIKQA